MITILFATMTGNAETCASELARELKKAELECRIQNLADYSAASLSDESVALLVVSTWGDGEPPDDAVVFHEQLLSLPTESLSNLSFAVFSLGDSGYEIFCGFGKSCDTALEAAGARRLLEVEVCDMDHDEKLPGWTAQVIESLKTNQIADGVS